MRRGCSLGKADDVLAVGSRNEKTKTFADGKSFTDCDAIWFEAAVSNKKNGLRTQTNPSPQKKTKKRRDERRREKKKREEEEREARRRSVPLEWKLARWRWKEEKRREERLPPPVLKQWASGFQSSCSSSVRRRLGYLSLV